MSRNLARRGASVLVAAALLGGGLVLGGGTASAAEGDLFEEVVTVLLSPLGSAAGPVQSGSAAVGSSESCEGVWEGVSKPGCFFDFRILPTELATLS